MIELINSSFECDRVIPFEFEISEGHEILIRALPCLADFAESFEAKYKMCYCTGEALGEIRKTCAEVIAPLGFKEDISSKHLVYEYRADDVLINKELIHSESHLIKNVAEVDFEKRILFDVRECVRSGGIASVTLNNGAVISVAAANMASDENNPAEITTETAVGYRGMGLSCSNAALLILELQKMGKSVIYKCRSTNFASMRVAEKLGLKCAKITYQYCGVIDK